MQLNIKSFALAGGTVALLWALLFHFVVATTGLGADFLKLILELHPGASLSFGGAIAHAIWMFAYGIAGGGIFAGIYNKLAR